MTTVYVLTARSGDTYRIERVYLDADQTYKFGQHYNGIAPVEPVQEWWTGDALAEAKVVRRELAGVPKIEVVGLSKETVEELF